MSSTSTDVSSSLTPGVFSMGSALAFRGEIKERQSEMLMSWSEHLLKDRGWPLPQHKRAMRCIIELLQNLSKHAGRGSYECGFHALGSFTLCSQNVVDEEQRSHIETAWEQATRPNLDELRETRLGKLVEGERTHQGGAGLGFMDLRMCSNGHVRIEFIPCGNQQSHFVLTVSIHP